MINRAICYKKQSKMALPKSKAYNKIYRDCYERDKRFFWL
jgi:hypothetical protein